MTLAITADPSLTIAYLFRAEAYLAVGELKRALEDADKAVALEPELSLTFRSGFYADQKQFDLALDDATAAINLRPTSAQSWAHRARVALQAGKFEAALADINQALKLDDVPPFYAVRADIYEKLGRAQEAIADRRRPIPPDYRPKR